MANRKSNPREKKLKDKIDELTTELARRDESLRLVDANLQNSNQQIKYMQEMLRDLKGRISELEDFQMFARYALPHLQPKLEYQAMNTQSTLKNGR